MGSTAAAAPSRRRRPAATLGRRFRRASRRLPDGPPHQRVDADRRRTASVPRSCCRTCPGTGSSIDDAVAHWTGPDARSCSSSGEAGTPARSSSPAPGRPSPGRVGASKVGSRYVQGRTAAGGWSQQTVRPAPGEADRRARRCRGGRGGAPPGEARAAPGGRRPRAAPRCGWPPGRAKALVAETLADPRLRRLADLPRAVHLAVGDPGRDLVAALPALLGSVTITLVPGDRQSSPDPR